MSYWLVRALQPIAAFDATRQPCKAKPMQRVWMKHADALAAAKKGYVQMLSPDGIRAFVTADGRPSADELEEKPAPAPTKRTYKRRDVKAED